MSGMVIKLEDSVHLDTGSQHSVIRLEGLDCADCAAKLEKRIYAIPGVEDAAVNFGASKMKVNHQVALEEIITVIEQMGYRGKEEKAAGSQEKAAPFWKNNNSISTMMAGGMIIFAFGMHVLQAPSALVQSAYILAIILGGYLPARAGISVLLNNRQMDMNVLMLLAAIGAVAIGQFEEGAMVVFLFSLGNAMQSYTMDKTRSSIRALMALMPDEALVRRNGLETVLPVKELRIGDIMIVRPGEKIAMDGHIVGGYSAVDEAAITGESIPVDKQPGDRVFAGTVNANGALEIEVESLAKDNTIARITTMIEDAQGQRAPAQQFIDRFASYYTPAVIIAAVLVALIPSIAMGHISEKWIYQALAMLLVACPCALIISTPVSIVSAIGSAARNGVLIKGGLHLEEMAQMQAVAFDKTGTLTRGKPELTEIIAIAKADKNEVLRLAAAIETRSEHPLAEAVVKYAQREHLVIPAISSFTAVPGKGAYGDITGKRYYVGNARLFMDLHIDVQRVEELIRLQEEQGRTIILLGDEKEILGLIALADRLRENSSKAVGELRKMGIAKTIMLSGDNEPTAKVMAYEAGIDEYRARLLPEDKVEVMKDLLQKHKKVVMVGDGVNDAPAMAISTVGVAMGAAGTDAALETADIALMADDLSKLAYTVKLGRKTMQIIRQNIAFSIIFKAALLLLVIPGWLTLWLAVLGDVGTSLLVTLNGIRLSRVKP